MAVQSKVALVSGIFIWMTLGVLLRKPLPVYSQSGANYSLRFYGNGVNGIDRVEIPINNPPVPADIGAAGFTIEWWMKALLSENGSSNASCGQDAGWIYGNILFDRDIFGDGDYGDFGISISDGKIVFGVSKGNSGNTICGVTNVADGLWHHVAVTRNQTNGELRIYVDGRLDAQGSGPTGDVSYRDDRLTPTQHPKDPYLVIGAEKHDYDRNQFPSYSGWVDEVRLSNVVRYTSDFNPPTTPFTSDANTMALYHFGEGPAGPCNGNVLDSAAVPGGPSTGLCRYGGDPAGPLYSTDNPFTVSSGTPTPPPMGSVVLPTNTRTPTPTKTPTPVTGPDTPTKTPTHPVVPPPPGDKRIYLPTVLNITGMILAVLLIGLCTLVFFGAWRWVGQHRSSR